MISQRPFPATQPSDGRRHFFVRIGLAALLCHACIETAPTATECGQDISNVQDDADHVDATLEHDAAPAPPTWVNLHGLPATNTLESDAYPGLDVCSLTFICPNGTTGFAVEAVADLGGGLYLDDIPEGHSIPLDPEKALGPGDASCLFSDDVLNFVTLGREGSINLRLAARDGNAGDAESLDLSGCTLHMQFAEGYVEPMLVEVCPSSVPEDCQPLAEVPWAFAPNGVNVFVPSL